MPPRRHQNPKTKAPSSILIAVTGMSPAVLTETVWALARETPPVIPERVVVVTTISGRQAIERELLTPPDADRPDRWQELRLALLGSEAARQERLILEPPRLVEAPNPRTGRMDWLEDLRTPAENSATANFLLGELRRWTEAPGTRLILSLAGGRKTMSALLCACASLLGREDDRLTHVLVNEPFDDPRLQPKFYFPGQSQQRLLDSAGREHQAAAAKIELADIPFVSFRNLFERDLIRRPSTYTELVQRCRTKVQEVARGNISLKIRRSRLSIEVNETPVRLSPLQGVLLLFLAENAKTGAAPPEKYSAALDPLRTYSAQLQAACAPDDFDDWRDGACLPADFDDQRLRKVLNEIKTKLRQAGPAAALAPRLPRRGRFTLDLPPSAISLRD